MDLFAEELRRHLRGSHRALREIVAALDDDALNWTPGDAMNSVAVLVTHALGSEAEVLRLVRGAGSDRDRPSEFMARADATELLALIDEADALLDELVPAITADDLQAEWRKPSAPTNQDAAERPVLAPQQLRASS